MTTIFVVTSRGWVLPRVAMDGPVALTVAEVKELLAAGYDSCCTAAEHHAVLEAVKMRYNLDVRRREPGGIVSLLPGDTVITLTVHGLGPLYRDQREYFERDVALATFEFEKWIVLDSAES